MPDLDPAHVEAVARALFRWNTPTDPHFVIHGRAGVVEDRDPYEPIAEAILTSTDPEVHSALLAALVRAGVIEGGWRVAGRAGRVQRRYVTRWEDVDA